MQRNLGKENTLYCPFDVFDMGGHYYDKAIILRMDWEPPSVSLNDFVFRLMNYTRSQNNSKFV